MNLPIEAPKISFERNALLLERKPARSELIANPIVLNEKTIPNSSPPISRLR